MLYAGGVRQCQDPREWTLTCGATTVTVSMTYTVSPAAVVTDCRLIPDVHVPGSVVTDSKPVPDVRVPCSVVIDSRRAPDVPLPCTQVTVSESPTPQRNVTRRRHKHSPSKRRRHLLFREWRRLARMNNDLFVLPCRRPTSPQEPDTELYQDVDVAPVIPMTVLDEREQEVSDIPPEMPMTVLYEGGPQAVYAVDSPNPDEKELPLGDDDSPSQAELSASLALMDTLYQRALLLERGSVQPTPTSTTVEVAPGDSVADEDLPDYDPSSPRYLFYLLESASGIT